MNNKEIIIKDIDNRYIIKKKINSCEKYEKMKTINKLF